MLGIVVVSYGSAELLDRNLAGLDRAAMSTPTTVVVVDNLRSAPDRDGVVALARRHAWDLVTNDGNPGFGAAANQGVRRAAELGCDAVAVLNPDLVVTPDVLDALADEVARHPDLLVAPQVVRPDGTAWFTGGVIDVARGRTRNVVLDGRPRRSGWLTGACVVAAVPLWRRLRGFAEEYHLYWEDVDLSFRATAAGARLLVRPDLQVVHEVGGTQGAGKSPVYMFHNCRNRLLFGARHMDRRTLLAWVLATPAESWRVLRRGGRRALVRRPALLAAGALGSLAGIGVAARALVGARPGARGTEAPRPAASGPGSSGRRRVVVAHPSADRYGSDRMVVESVAGLVEAGRDVVFTVPADGPLVPLVEAAGARVELVPVPVVSKAYLSPRRLPRLAVEAVVGVVRAWRLLGRLAPAAVYVSTVTIPWWSFAARLRRLPTVTHVHEAERSARRVVRLLLTAPLVLSDRVVANSRFALTTAIDVLPRLAGRSRLVRNGVVGPPQPVPARDDAGDDVRLVYVGRLSPRKGVDVAVRATALLVERGVGASLDVVGDVFPGYEWYRAELEELVDDLGVADRVHLHGFQDPPWRYYAGADVALVPSRVDEPFGNTAVEAVLCARPVVVSGCGGLVEAVEGFGSARVVTPGDAEAIADAVAALLAEWAQVREAALADAVTAHERHAPAGYRAQIADAVAEVAR